MIEIPKNTYSVESDPIVEETIAKCLAELEKYDTVIIDRHPLNESHRSERVCIDHDCVGYEVVRHFTSAGYHGAVVTFIGNGGVSEFEISRKPIERNYNKTIIL